MIPVPVIRKRLCRMYEVPVPSNPSLTPPICPSISFPSSFSSHVCASFHLHHTPALPSPRLPLLECMPFINVKLHLRIENMHDHATIQIIGMNVECMQTHYHHVVKVMRHTHDTGTGNTLTLMPYE